MSEATLPTDAERVADRLANAPTPDQQAIMEQLLVEALQDAVRDYVETCGPLKMKVLKPVEGRADV
jgi:hypothetical protein